MAAKASPKYPRKNTALFKRYLAQASLLLLGIGAALFYVFIHNAPPEDDALTALDRLATAIHEDGQGAGQGPGTPPATAGGKAANADAAPPEGRATDPGAAKTNNATDPTAAPDTGDAPRTAASLIMGGQSPARQEAAFTDKSLDAVAAELSRRYSGRAPAAWGEHMPGIIDNLPSADAAQSGPLLALTLDACGGKKGASFDAALIVFLRKQAIPATIFVTSSWLRTNPEALRDLAADPLFEIAAHGSNHKPCSVSGNSVYGIKGTTSVLELVREVEGNARDIARATGFRPRWFRSGTAYYDDVAVSIIGDLDLHIAGYSVAADEGATLPADKVAAKLKAAKNGDILLLHVNKPASGTREGLQKALPELMARGARFVRLSEAFAPAEQ